MNELVHPKVTGLVEEVRLVSFPTMVDPTPDVPKLPRLVVLASAVGIVGLPDV